MSENKNPMLNKDFLIERTTPFMWPPVNPKLQDWKLIVLEMTVKLLSFLIGTETCG